MKETSPKPALRISHIVYGRKHENGRVKYLVDPLGSRDEFAIPEEVVLRRWRRRRFPDFVFSGERLSPTLWRALPVLFNSPPEKWELPSVDALEKMRQEASLQMLTLGLRLPAAETMKALFSVCGPKRLRALVERHAGLGPNGRSGVPDLFLYAKGKTGKPSISRFVEVKKPEEPVSADQLDEIRFMKSLGLHARVLRLIERKKS
jgi:hypothetical protein